MIELVAGDLSVGLVPEIGGSVAFFRRRSRGVAVDLMRPLAEEARTRRDPLGAAMFPMVPYANRIADNRFDFEGHTYDFLPNLPGERFNVHGTGWQSAWTVAGAGATEAEFSLDQRDPAQPYSFLARQKFVLTPAALVVQMALTNTGPRRMPFGLGQHPWFPRDPGVTLRFHAEHFWLEGPDNVATDRIATPPELDFSAARTLPRTWRNNCYGAWDGSCEIRFPGRDIGLRIAADPVFAHLMLYCDPSKPFFCAEPQTNAVCAFNKMSEDGGRDLGVIVLDPGASAQGSIAFAHFDL